MNKKIVSGIAAGAVVLLVGAGVAEYTISRGTFETAQQPSAGWVEASVSGDTSVWYVYQPTIEQVRPGIVDAWVMKTYPKPVTGESRSIKLKLTVGCRVNKTLIQSATHFEKPMGHGKITAQTGLGEPEDIIPGSVFSHVAEMVCRGVD